MVITAETWFLGQGMIVHCTCLAFVNHSLA